MLELNIDAIWLENIELSLHYNVKYQIVILNKHR